MASNKPKKGKDSKSSKTKVTATEKYKKKIKSFSSMIPDYEEKYFKGKYTPTPFESSYTPTEFVDNYEPVEYNDSYNPEQYDSKYMPQIEERTNALNNWNYDPLQDASYQALAKVYGARGNLAAKNSLADAAALNGGMGTSYAVSAAQQARNQYNQELASMIPQLEQASYERQQSGLNNLMALDESQYGRFSDDQSRQLQSKQFGLDVAGYNEGNRQFKANYGLDVAGFNEGNKQFAANYDLDVAKFNDDMNRFKFSSLLDAYNANTGERHYGYDADVNRVTTGADMASGFWSWNQAYNKPKTGTGGGGGGSRGGGGYTNAISGGNTIGNRTPTYDSTIQSVIMGSGKNGQNVRSAKGLTTIKEKNKKSGGRVIL